jgi:hypothetical protein
MVSRDGTVIRREDTMTEQENPCEFDETGRCVACGIDIETWEREVQDKASDILEEDCVAIYCGGCGMTHREPECDI